MMISLIDYIRLSNPNKCQILEQVRITKFRIMGKHFLFLGFSFPSENCKFRFNVPF